VRQEIEAAGFKLVAEGDFLRHPEDPGDAAFPSAGADRRVRAEVPEAVVRHGAFRMTNGNHIVLTRTGLTKSYRAAAKRSRCCAA
jgi:hypothetical protein